jgi:transposase-like protein
VEHVEKLEGEADTKTRLKLVLLSLNGELSVNVAAERMGVSPSRFHEVRDAALMGALEALSPKAAGRPSRATLENARVADLEEELTHTRYELEVERVRSSLLIVMPELVAGKRFPPRVERGGRGGDRSRTKR